MKSAKSLVSAFTLIELLIVVAIIAILAAIAVPNFLEAQVRAKASRAKSDLRTIHTGLESYRIDNTNIPLMNNANTALCPPSKVGQPKYKYTLERLTTPISYLTGGVFTDPFGGKRAQRLNGTSSEPTDAEQIKGFSEYFYAVRGTKANSTTQEHLQWDDPAAKPQWGLLQSSGPKGIKWYFGSEVNSYLANDNPITRGVCLDMIYDATNGTMSAGTIVRVVGQPDGRGSVLGKVFQTVN